MPEASRPELNPNNPFLFEECVTQIGTFAMRQGRPMVARHEADEWRYYPIDGDEPTDAMVRLAEIEDAKTHEPQLRYVVAHSGMGTEKVGYLAELAWTEDALPPTGADAALHMPTEDALRFYSDYRAVHMRFARDPTGARHLISTRQLDDVQLATLRDELGSLRII